MLKYLPMPVADEQLKLLKEIRDLQREQLSLIRSTRDETVRSQKTHGAIFIAHVVYNAAIVVFVIVAFYYFYHTMMGVVPPTA